MQIDVHAPEYFLEEFRLHLQDQFAKQGWTQGPKVGSIDRGHMTNFLKGESIVSLEISEESEGHDPTLHLESEVEIPELDEIWDRAIVVFGKELFSRLTSIARNKDKVTQELKK